MPHPQERLRDQLESLVQNALHTDDAEALGDAEYELARLDNQPDTEQVPTTLLQRLTDKNVCLQLYYDQGRDEATFFAAGSNVEFSNWSEALTEHDVTMEDLRRWVPTLILFFQRMQEHTQSPITLSLGATPAQFNGTPLPTCLSWGDQVRPLPAVLHSVFSGEAPEFDIHPLAEEVVFGQRNPTHDLDL